MLRLNRVFACLLLIAVGCKSVPPQPAVVTVSARSSQALTASPTPLVAARPVVATPVAYQEPVLAAPLPAPAHSLGFQEELESVLSREWLQREVENRNPSLEAMVSAWQAATQLYPQRVALDDPMLMGMIAPQSAASSATETAYAFQLNQKLPWFGKRSFRGAVASADADAAFQEAENTRLVVRLTADMAFFDYFSTTRLLEINRENLQNAEEFQRAAQARYRANQVTQQDVTQAELELAELSRRQLELERMHQVAIARLNTLLRRWPEAPLPPAPVELNTPKVSSDSTVLWQSALQQRPDLAALASRVQSEEAALGLAYKNLYPDVDVFGRYDTFWQPVNQFGPLRASVGVAVNLPVYREKLQAAICEAQFRLNQRRAEYEQRSVEIQYEVISGFQQVEESRKTVELYSQRLIPAAKQNVTAARSNYEVNKSSFIELALTQRQLVSMRERELEAIVTYQRRLAELERSIGGPILETQ